MEFNMGVLKKIAELMAEELREVLGTEAQIDEMEQGMRELAKEVSGLGLQKVIEVQEGKYATDMECVCGEKAEPRGKREAVVWSVFGKVNYRRRYYFCPHCHRGQSPLDERLGLTPGQSTPGLASSWGWWAWRPHFEKPANWRNAFYCFP